MTEKTKPTARAMLYNETGSQIFTGKEAIEAAKKDGWKDKPVKVAQPPKGGDETEAAKVQELNKALANMHEDLKAAKSAQAEAESQLAEAVSALTEAEERANAAEAENKKLAAALKKAQPDAGK